VGTLSRFFVRKGRSEKVENKRRKKTIVCRYFSVMLRTSQAQFHIGFLNLRWFIPSHPNIKDRLFHPASKFDDNSTNLPLENNFDFLNLTDDDSISNNNMYVSLSKQRLYYSNAQGLAKQASQIACKTCNELFITLLEVKSWN
jgi:hypothetical protein